MYTDSVTHIFICEWKSYSLEMTLVWGNDDRIFFIFVNYPFNSGLTNQHPGPQIPFNNATVCSTALCLRLSGADLRIGELQWGDSGVYFCKVVISDDLEGQNEAHVELLVLGERSQETHTLTTGSESPDADLLPDPVQLKPAEACFPTE